MWLKIAESFLHFWRWEVHSGSWGTKTRLVLPLEALRENLFLCLLSSREGSCVPWLMAALLRPPLPSSVCFSDSDLLAFVFQGPLWVHWAHPGNPGESSHGKSLHLVPSAKSLCRVRSHTGSRDKDVVTSRSHNSPFQPLGWVTISSYNLQRSPFKGQQWQRLQGGARAAGGQDGTSGGLLDTLCFRLTMNHF